MKKEILIAWERSVREKMRKELPMFEEYKKKERGEEKGILRYRMKAANELWCFILFRPIKDEAFDVYLGWSKRERCPYVDSKVFDYDEKEFEDFDKPFFMKSSMLFVPRSGVAYWSFLEIPDEIIDDPDAFAEYMFEHEMKSYSEEDAMAFVRDAVNKGFHEIIKYGIPYLQKRISYERKSVK